MTKLNSLVEPHIIARQGFSQQVLATAVPLAADGDFTIDDVLSPVPPAGSANAILLIRGAGLPGDPWFAAGIPVVFQ